MKKTIIITTLLIVSSVMITMSAQTHLKKWAEKCESEDGVNYSIISKKDRTTKQPISTLISISFNKDAEPFLLDELHEAIIKDKKDAIEVIESKKNGTLKPEIYKFYDEATKQDVTYIFSESKSGRLSVVITTGGGNKMEVLKSKVTP